MRFLLLVLTCFSLAACTNAVPQVSFLNQLVSQPSLSFQNEVIFNNQKFLMTFSSNVSLLNAGDYTDVAIGEGVSCDSLAWQPKADVYALSLSPGDGAKTISYTYKKNGVVSSCQTESVIVDTTPPAVPTIDDMIWGRGKTKSTTSSWSASTDSSGFIKGYEIAIGTTAGGTDVVPWTSLGNITSYQNTNLNLDFVTTYYTSVRAIDAVGNISTIGTGDGWQPAWVGTASTDSPMGSVLAVVKDAAGNKILGGSFTQVGGAEASLRKMARLNSDGTIDSTFKMGAGFDAPVTTLAVQSDGKIIAGGFFITYNGTSQNKITRLNADGTRDTSFNIGTGFVGGVNAILLQSDGKILVGGDFTSYNGTAQSRITRLNADGSRDTTFNIGTGFSGGGGVRTLLLQSDGKILVGGFFIAYNGTTQNRITRLNSDGTLDTTFIIGTGFDAYISTIAVQNDGKILIGGAFTTYQGASANRIVRLNTDGSLDSSFNIGTGFNWAANFLTIQSDGKILVGGQFSSYNGTSQNRITRLNADGTRDTTFDIGSGFLGNNVESLSLQGDGRLLAGGSFVAYNGTNQFGFTRINTDGLRDTTLSNGTGFSGPVNTITQQSDGKILIGGDFNSYGAPIQNNIVKISPNGTKDATFNTGTGFSSQVETLAFQSDGKILVGGGFTAYNGTIQNYLSRLNPDGTMDASFNMGSGFNISSVKTLALQSDGKILVGGGFTAYNGTTQKYITRLNADGTRDTTFNIGTGFGSPVTTLVVQSDGKIIVGGFFITYNGTSQNKITRLNADGSIDTTFNIGTGFTSDVYALALQSDGKIMVGGNFAQFNGVTAKHIIRLNTDGSVDSTFNTGTGFNGSVKFITLQSDGKILVSGLFTTYNGVSQKYITRLNADGSLDTSLNIGDGFLTVPSILLSEDPDSIFVGGDFTIMNGDPCTYICTLKAIEP